MCEILLKVAPNHFKEITRERKKQDWSDSTEQLFQKRQEARNERDWTLAAVLHKQFRKNLKYDKTQQLLRSFHEDLDLRSKWMGLRWLRKGYVPTRYHRRDKDGKHIEMGQRAEAAANYLEKTQWGTETTLREPLPTHKVIAEQVQICEDDISTEEVGRAIKRLKIRKSGGPDGTTIELFKSMGNEAREAIRGILNGWWRSNKIDKEALQAKVVHLYKKG